MKIIDIYVLPTACNLTELTHLQSLNVLGNQRFLLIILWNYFVWSMLLIWTQSHFKTQLH